MKHLDDGRNIWHKIFEQFRPWQRFNSMQHKKFNTQILHDLITLVSQSKWHVWMHSISVLHCTQGPAGQTTACNQFITIYVLHNSANSMSKVTIPILWNNLCLNQSSLKWYYMCHVDEFLSLRMQEMVWILMWLRRN